LEIYQASLFKKASFAPAKSPRGHLDAHELYKERERLRENRGGFLQLELWKNHPPEASRQVGYPSMLKEGNRVKDKISENAIKSELAYFVNWFFIILTPYTK